MDQFLKQHLDVRRKQGNLRSLKALPDHVDFCSNDYLGFARSPELRASLTAAWQACHDVRLGATGSRLLTGHSQMMEELEQALAAFHQAKSGLLFNSGYTANLGLISTIAQPDDLILYDAHIHASMHDGMRLSAAKCLPWRHNDASHLEHRLKASKSTGKILVLTESIYSCDGTLAPLADVAGLCEQFGAFLIVDEAHATGIIGTNGEGLVQHLGLHNKVFARIHTFSKALGSCGAVVLGKELLKDYLINFCRPLIYATAMPLTSLLTIRQAYQMLPQSLACRSKIGQLIRHFKEQAQRASLPLILSDTPIQSILTPGNASAHAAAACMQKNGFDLRPLLSPTVKRGTERLRLCLHAFNTNEQIDALISTLQSCTTS